jgi:Raf kinase inhibitor-like YbhB/YbcL family protein
MLLGIHFLVVMLERIIEACCSVTGLDFIHWFVINISCTADTLKVPENASGSPLLLPQGSIELSNSNNKTGYHAPCPPDRDHTYIFRICLVKNMSNRNDWSTLYDARDVVRRLEGSLCGFLLGIYPRASEHCKQAS